MLLGYVNSYIARACAESLNFELKLAKKHYCAEYEKRFKYSCVCICVCVWGGGGGGGGEG